MTDDINNNESVSQTHEIAAHDIRRRIAVLKSETYEAVRQIMEWDGLQMDKLSGGLWDVESLIVSDEPWMLDYFRTGHDLHVKGDRPHGDYAFLLGGTYDLPFHHKGLSFQPGQMLLRSPDFIADDFLPAGMHGIGVRIKADYFLNNVLPRLPLETTDSLRSGAAILSVPEKVAVDMSEWFMDVLEDLRKDNFSAATLQRCCERLMDLYCECAAGSEQTLARPLTVGDHHNVIKKLEDHFTHNAYDPPSLNTLCQVAACSQRTLYNILVSHFEKSPCQYMHTLRLNGIYKELSSSNNRSGLVTELAYKWGFWHLGRFSRDYKQLFGELPKETLLK